MKLRFLTWALLVGASCGARADAEHDRIGAERAAANARLVEQERDCNSRFIVAPCLEAARNESRATLSRLRQQELQLDEGRRKAAAEARRKAIAEKAEAQQARASEPAPEAPRVHVREAPQPRPVNPSRANGIAIPHAPGGAASGADRSSVERANEAKFDEKTRAAQAHRDAVAKRNAERAARGKVVAPLPLPKASAASAPR